MGLEANGARDCERRLTRLDAFAGVCFLLSGFLALAYEVCWIRKASLVFGTATFALSTVLAVFFGGLALGSWGIGTLTSRIQRPLRAYAALEMALGGFVLLTPWLFRAIDAVYSALYPHLLDSFWLTTVVRVGLVAVILLPPTVLMGGTLPLFCRHYVARPETVHLSVGFLYGLNTLGAAIGAAATGFVLVPRIGIHQTLYGGAALNLIMGLAVWKSPLGGAVTHVPQVDLESTDSPGQPLAPGEPRLRWLPTLFLLGGFVALANEILWSRFLTLIIHGSVYSYTLMLTTVLAGIVLGSFVAARWFGRVRRQALAFGCIHLAIGLSVLLALLAPTPFWREWINVPSLAGQATVVALILLVPAILAGLSFPTGIALVVESIEHTGSIVGRMTALNTVGGIGGSLVAGFLLLPHVGIYATLGLVTGLSLIIGVIAIGVVDQATPRLGKALIIGAAAIAWLGIPRWTGTTLPQDLLVQRGELIDFREGIGSFVAVVENEGRKELEVDRLWQGIDRKSHQVMAAHIPMFLHPHPKRVLVIGLGPGQTAGRFLKYDIDHLDCVEIERDLVPLVREHFDAAWLDDPRVRLLIDDGRNHVAHTRESYDIISVEVGQTYRPGVAGFYTLDFYQQARERLAPDGLACQFVPISSFTADEFRTVVATFRAAFPDSVLWYNTVEFLLIGGTRPPRLSEDRVRELLAQPAIHEDLDFAYWGGTQFHLNREPVIYGGFLADGEGLSALSAGAPVYRDNRPWLEYAGALAYRPVAPVLSEVTRHLDPLDSILKGTLDPKARAEAAEVRRLNLANAGINDLRKEIDQARQLGDARITLDLMNQAVAQNPYNTKVRMELADLLSSLGELPTAVNHYRRITEEDPDFEDAHLNLGNALCQLGFVDEGTAEFQRAVELNPAFASAYYNLGVSHETRGEYALAMQSYERAVHLEPNEPDFLRNLAWLLASAPEDGLRNGRQALELAERANALSPGDPRTLACLAAAQAEVGDFVQAERTALNAIKIYQNENAPGSVQSVERQLERYREREPYRLSVR